MRRFLLQVLLLLSIHISLFSQNDVTNDKTKIQKADTSDSSDDAWVYDYINYDPSDDLYSGLKSKRHKIKKSYVENLKWNPYINLYIDDLDRNNFVKNTNILPWFPYIFAPYGGYSYNRGFDIGFLYRMDNIENTMMSFTTATSFGQRTRFWQHFNMEYSNVLKDNRLKLLWTFSVFTSAPQYYSALSFYDKSNQLLYLFNYLWDKLSISMNQFNETGFYFISGADYRIPKLELNSISLVEFLYKYDSNNITSWNYNNEDKTKNTPNIETINRSNFSFNISEEVRWQKIKQTVSFPTGNILSAKVKFYIPTTVGSFSSQFRFKSTIEDKFTYKFFREFAFKTRILLAANYNISEDFSGDPFIRGYVDKELTGFFALLGNFELCIPVIDVAIKEAANITLKKDARFILFLNMFMDTGFTIDKFDFPLENFAYDVKRSPALNTFNSDLGGNYSLIPAFSLGGGLTIYPYFLNFIIRLDVGVNILKAAIYYNQVPDNKKNETTSIEFTLSFSEMF
jgi:hypothetical protein